MKLFKYIASRIAQSANKCDSNVQGDARLNEINIFFYYEIVINITLTNFFGVIFPNRP